MRTLRFVGLDDSGTRLLFLADDDGQHAAEVDDRLVQAVRRTHGWPRKDEAGTGGERTQSEGQDTDVDTPTVEQTVELRPREIQSRVRAGESPAELAADSGVDLERIVRFARPVLQEREHVAAAAQRVVVRTGALDGPLGEVVADRLGRFVSDVEPVWDAWRQGDGRWTVALTFHDDVQPRTARWSFDPSTNSVTVDDETARWLTEGTSPHAPPLPPTPGRPQARRLLSVPDLEPQEDEAHDADATDSGVDSDDPAVPDLADLADVGDAAEDSADAADDLADELAALGLQAVARARESGVLQDADSTDEAADRTGAQAELDLRSPSADPEPAEAEADAAPEASTAEPDEADRKPARKPRKAARRASVPSWDDIVFGARKPD